MTGEASIVASIKASGHRKPRSAPWPAVAFVVMLVQLLALNGYSWWRNQRTFVAEDRPRVVPRNIARVASLNNYDVVKYVFNLYYQLRALRGATIVIPYELRGHQFFLEEVSRLKVEIVPAPAPLANDFLDRLRYDHMVTDRVHLDASTWVDVVIVRGARRYLWTRTVDGAFFVILPEALYREEDSRPS